MKSKQTCHLRNLRNHSKVSHGVGDTKLRISNLEGIQPTALQDLNDVLYRSLSGGEKIRKTNLIFTSLKINFPLRGF